MRTNNQAQFSFRGVRSSKFRHIFGSPARRDRSYDNLKITRNAHDGNFCAANPKFVAIVTEVAGGGAFVVIPLEKTGRVDPTVGRVAGHSGPVMDIKWNPFNDNVIASGSDDCTVKVWYIPEGGLTGNLNEWLVDLRGHKRRVSYLDWHPTAENVLLSAGLDHLIIVWNIGKGEVINAIDCHPDVIYSMSLNRDGSLLATTCKDKRLRVIEPRSGRVIQEGQCHEGAKACKVAYLGGTGRILTTGFSKFSDRQYGVWDERRLTEPLRLENIDSSSGILYPFYDPDTRVLFLAGKGDGNIRYYEIVDEPPWCHYLNQYISGSPQRGLGVLTKRAVDTHKCEIFRFFKLHATKDLCEPLTMIVPRKSDQFQEDIYPDTAAPTPSLTAEEWATGQNKPPVLMSLRTVGLAPGVAVRTNKPAGVNRAQDGIIGGDRNTDRKFAFISSSSRPDYRPQQERLNEANKVMTKFQQIQQMWTGQSAEEPPADRSLPPPSEPAPPATNHQTMPLKSWNGLPSSQQQHTPPQSASPVRQPSGRQQQPSSPVRQETPHKADVELRKRYAEQAEEIKQLKNMLNIKEQRIRELEDQLDRVLKTRDESEA